MFDMQYLFLERKNAIVHKSYNLTVPVGRCNMQNQILIDC